MNKSKKIIFYTISFTMLATISYLGYASTNYMANKIETDERSNLLLRAQTVAILIKTEDLKNLAGNSSDINSPTYINLKEVLGRVRSVNTDARFVYMLGQENNKQFFYVDSETTSSGDYSAPGDFYNDALPKDIENYKNKILYTKGPYTDTWGSWFSAFAPILDKDGNMLGQLVMDIESDKLLLRISIVRQATIIIFSLLFLSALVVLLLMRDSSPFRVK